MMWDLRHYNPQASLSNPLCLDHLAHNTQRFVFRVHTLSTGHWDVWSHSIALHLVRVFSILPPVSCVCTHAAMHNLCVISSFASLCMLLKGKGIIKDMCKMRFGKGWVKRQEVELFQIYQRFMGTSSVDWGKEKQVFSLFSLHDDWTLSLLNHSYSWCGSAKSSSRRNRTDFPCKLQRKVWAAHVHANNYL